MVQTGGRPLQVASLIDENFECLERVDNNLNRYYWKCKHCGDTNNSSGHAGEVERTFSDLGTTQSARRCNLSVDTFETLGKIRANVRHHSAMKAAEAGKPTCRRHAHMHTHEEVGIAVETAQDLEASFAWAPPLSTEPRDADDLACWSREYLA
ncbi:hypothetical protein DFJ58DRAFT_758768 [Suillus subalutaceus]|uniref:uncharacterized protein n=1 Tax=Suillus subalutaceus TaxID=48586 RepID=UPI001B86AFE8|nr:uncharacterized protein DFJ58DRAFT_758768 [Suillus subalutaceus]KAG1874788.1 hypothetical protein DFJ58DRAFT_758768 [Suillus subalutaceus]